MDRLAARDAAHERPAIPGARARLLRALLLAVGVVAACSTIRPPLLKTQQSSTLERRIDRLAVVPFFPKPRLSRSTSESGLEAWEAAALVTRFVTEAIQKRGGMVIPESDVQLAFTGQGHVTPRMDPKAAAELAATQFGATAVLLGSVERYREREGSAAGSMRPASVAYDVELYAAPSGRRVWRARFDQTQASLTSDPFRSSRLPGGGTRFLTVAELARFGAGLVAEKIPLGTPG